MYWEDMSRDSARQAELWVWNWGKLSLRRWCFRQIRLEPATGTSVQKHCIHRVQFSQRPFDKHLKKRKKAMSGLFIFLHLNTYKLLWIIFFYLFSNYYSDILCTLHPKLLKDFQLSILHLLLSLTYSSISSLPSLH